VHGVGVLDDHHVLALQAGDDQHITKEKNDAFEAALTEAGVEHEIVIYDGAPHSFFDRKQQEFQADSDDAWSRALFDHWREQRPNLDDGLALFVFTADKQVRLQVGPTLAVTLPEGAVARVDHVIDDVRSQEKDPADWDNPIAWTIYSLSDLQSWLGKIPPEPLPEIFQDTDRRAKMTLWESLANDWEKDPGSVFLLAAIVFGVVILFVTHPLLTLGYVCLGFAGQILGGVGGAAGKVAGGLFSGGGGSSGGGGASGSW
jgi:hypothetical protein